MLEHPKALIPKEEKMSEMEQWAISSEKLMDIALQTMAYSFGTFLGNGHCNYNPGYGYTTEISSPDIEVVEKTLSQINWMFSKNYKPIKRKLKKNSYIYLGRSYTQAVHDFFMVNTEYRKMIPKALVNAPKESKLELIAGLFDTDGTVKETTNPNRDPRWQLEFSSTSLQMIESLASILQRMGVKVGKMHRYQRGGYRTLYSIHPNLRSFHAAGCYFSSNRKQNRLEAYLDHVLGSETVYAASLTQDDDPVRS